MGKIKTASELQKTILNLKRKKKTIVFTNGCFDLLHPGHLKILNTAKRKGDIVVVGLNSDFSVKKIKGKKRPILSQKARAKILENIASVDFIVIFNQTTPYALIKKLKPDVLVKGGDWKNTQIVGRNLVKRICRVKISPGYSTSRIIRTIKKNA